MYDRQLQASNHLLMPPSSSYTHPSTLPHLPTMNMNRSASPATSRGSEVNDASLSPHNPQSPDANLDGSNKGRALSTSKRAEQNRRAQRAFRERRDARVRSLEARAILLEEAIGKAEEANRRWEECRVLVDQLRHENAMLRNALDEAGGNSDNIPTTLPHSNGHGHDIYDDVPRDGNTNGVDNHETIRLEEAGANGPSKKRKRIEDSEMDSRSSLA